MLYGSPNNYIMKYINTLHKKIFLDKFPPHVRRCFLESFPERDINLAYAYLYKWYIHDNVSCMAILNNMFQVTDSEYLLDAFTVIIKFASLICIKKEIEIDGIFRLNFTDQLMVMEITINSSDCGFSPPGASQRYPGNQVVTL